MSVLGVSFSPRAKRLAPFFLAGPISGPLLAGVVFNFREGRPILGSLYAVALTEVVIFLPLITAKLGIQLI
jgi:hypothetical protein